MRLIIAILCAGVLLIGCKQSTVVDAAHLLLYGMDPLMHTVYIGSDDKFHHFACQNGKSGGEVLVRRDEAKVEPETFDLRSNGHRFVESVEPGVIHLFVLKKSD